MSPSSSALILSLACALSMATVGRAASPAGSVKVPASGIPSQSPSMEMKKAPLKPAVVAPVLNPPAVTAAQPASLRLKPGAAEVTVVLGGANLERLTKAQPLLDGTVRPGVTTVLATVSGSGVASRELRCKAVAGAAPGRYRVRLEGAGAVMVLPLETLTLEVAAPAPSPVAAKAAPPPPLAKAPGMAATAQGAQGSTVAARTQPGKLPPTQTGQLAPVDVRAEQAAQKLGVGGKLGQKIDPTKVPGAGKLGTFQPPMGKEGLAGAGKGPNLGGPPVIAGKDALAKSAGLPGLLTKGDTKAPLTGRGVGNPNLMGNDGSYQRGGDYFGVDKMQDFADSSGDQSGVRTEYHKHAGTWEIIVTTWGGGTTTQRIWVVPAGGSGTSSSAGSGKQSSPSGTSSSSDTSSSSSTTSSSSSETSSSSSESGGGSSSSGDDSSSSADSTPMPDDSGGGGTGRSWGQLTDEEKQEVCEEAQKKRNTVAGGLEGASTRSACIAKGPGALLGFNKRPDRGNINWGPDGQPAGQSSSSGVPFIGTSRQPHQDPMGTLPDPDPEFGTGGGFRPPPTGGGSGGPDGGPDQ